jgi:hypothetical protein
MEDDIKNGLKEAEEFSGLALTAVLLAIVRILFRWRRRCSLLAQY